MLAAHTLGEESRAQGLMLARQRILAVRKPLQASHSAAVALERRVSKH